MNGCQCSHCKVLPHASDCALHNEPALPIGPCDCGAMGGDWRYAEGFRAGLERAAQIAEDMVLYTGLDAAAAIRAETPVKAE